MVAAFKAFSAAALPLWMAVAIGRLDHMSV
jgi:hypothetical protein